MVSIIIPTYNNEQTIERAILSVASQTYSDWQLIVVNDGSNDKTDKILEKYKNIKVIFNKENKGVGISRKIGIDNADGDFIVFLDSDDYLKEDFLEKCITLQKECDADIVYCSYTIKYSSGIEQYLPSGDYIMEGDGTSQLYFIKAKQFLTGKLFRKSLIEKIPWSNKRVGEDVQTLFFALYTADKVRSSSYSGYIHCVRKNSLLANKTKFFTYCVGALAEFEIIDFLIEHNEEKLWKYMLAYSANTYMKLCDAIDKGVEFTNKDIKDNRESWKYVNKWYKQHEYHLNKINIKFK